MKRNEEDNNPWHNIPILEPNIKYEDSVLGKWRETHPAYGMINVSRCQGGDGEYFGSGIKHNNFISLIISRGERCRDEYGDYYFSKDNMIEIHMTTTQWAELITTMNYGSGTPCTLYAIEDEETGHMMPIPKIKFNSRKTEINNDLKIKMDEIAKDIIEDEINLKEILSKKGAINKSEKKQIAWMMEKLHQNIKSNLPFLHTCMQKAVDNTVTEAKGEIDSYLTNAITSLGERALSNPDNQIEAIKGIKLIGEKNE